MGKAMVVERVAERASVAMPGRLRQAGAKPLEVAMHNLSTHGFQSDTVHKVRPGQRVWLQLGTLGAMQAEVRWFRNYRIGCAFAQPMHPAVFDAVVSAAARA